MHKNPLLLSRVIAVSAICLATSVVRAQAPTPAPQVPAQISPVPSRPARPTPALTRQDVETFFDGMIPIQLRQNDIAGVVVSVVKDGTVLFTKGYGFSDVQRRTPVTTDATLFRIGSVSKTFTWTAVMQLVEQGKIDLDRDVNSYIDFRIPAPSGKPVTMRHLLSHTPGFDQPVKDMILSDSTNLDSLGTYLKTHVPREIYVPGTTPSYSNYGATLAGYIVERVSGIPFNEYVRRNILQPLGMTRATFDQPLPAELKPMMSQGYEVASRPPKYFEFVQAWPAGSMSATAEAMSRYMIAHLRQGEYQGARILKPETARLMHSRLFAVSPAMNGMAYGFYEESRNGHRIIGHGGDTQWFHSDMHLVPDENLGFFISANSSGKGVDLRSAVWEGFLDRYFPYTPPPVADLASALADARAVAGTYESSRRSESSVVAAFRLFQEKVVVNDDSTISGSARDAAGNPKRFREIAPFVFREVNGQSLMAFTKDPEGNFVMSFDAPFIVAQAVPPSKNGAMNFALVGFAMGIFALTLVGWPVAMLLRKHYGAAPVVSARYRRVRWLVRAASFAALLFVTLFAIKFLSALEGDLAKLSSQADASIHLLQVIGFVGLLGLPIAAIYSVSSWRDRSLWVGTRVWNTLLVVAFAAYTVFLLNWSLLNVNLNY